MDFLSVLNERGQRVERALDSYLPRATDYPAVIHEAMRYSVFAGGKRLRPALVLAGAEAAGGDPETVLPAACALELLHTYSLIHDDLPAMDNDDFRRGKPTNHKVFGEPIAILAGDALLTLTFELLARNMETAPVQAVSRVVQEVARAAGTFGLIGGQVVDTVSEGQSIDGATLEYIHRNKTGALYRVAVRSGAILAGAGTRELQALTDYAEQLGLAFQIKDDILDIEGDTAKLGKPVGSDEKNHKATYPALYGLAAAKDKAAAAAQEALQALEIFGPEVAFLREMVHFIVNRDH